VQPLVLLTRSLPADTSRALAVEANWESGAIAWVAARNRTPCLILRGVTDLVGERGGEAYGDLDFFAESAESVMRQLVVMLPGWLDCGGEGSA
jgi:adenosylhomocysteine nucleosidase